MLDYQVVIEIRDGGSMVRRENILRTDPLVARAMDVASAQRELIDRAIEVLTEEKAKIT